MESVSDNAPLIVILGPTASGKSRLAMELAKRFNGEIIAADSRTIYLGMDIGTAKPTISDQRSVRHHLLDIRNLDQPFNASEFQALARQAITDIAARGKVPFLVGGTGLYIDAVVYDFTFRRPADQAVRGRLQELSIYELQALLEERGIALPANPQNPRHLIRALETNGEVPKKATLRPHTLLLGLDVPKDALAVKIQKRINEMLESGFIQEVKRLAEQYGWEVAAMQSPGYREFRAYLEGHIPLAEATHRFVHKHIQYAKRQKTWFKRNRDIHWISNLDEAVESITTFLNK